MHKKLYRSQNNKVLAGVLGGLAEYTESDATVWWLLFIFLVIFTGFFPGVVAYIIAILMVPKEPITAAPVTSTPTGPDTTV